MWHALYKWVDVEPGASGELVLWRSRVPAKLVIHRVEVYFPVGCEGALSVALATPIEQLYPEPGSTYRGDDVLLVSVARREVPPGQPLIVRFANEDPENTLAFAVHISAEEVEP